MPVVPLHFVLFPGHSVQPMPGLGRAPDSPAGLSPSACPGRGLVRSPWAHLLLSQVREDLEQAPQKGTEMDTW